MSRSFLLRCRRLRFQGSMWDDQKRFSLGVPEDVVLLSALKLILARFLGIGGLGQYVGVRRVPPASVKALVRTKPFSEQHLNAGLAGITSPGHSRDSPALDLSSSLSATPKFHFAASLASSRRRRVSLRSSVTSEDDTSPVIISFAPSLSAAQKATNTDCRLSGGDILRNQELTELRTWNQRPCGKPCLQRGGEVVCQKMN